MGQTREQKVLKALMPKPQVQKQVPIIEGMFLPNHSGTHDAGIILKTPSKDTDIPNKKYVDDSIPDLTPYAKLDGSNQPFTGNLQVSNTTDTARLLLQGAGDTYNYSAVTLNNNDGTDVWNIQQRKEATEINDLQFEYYNGATYSTKFTWDVSADVLDLKTHRISNVVDPTANQDAATKKYVDDNGGCSFGTDNQIPYTNAAGDDFDYNSGFLFDGSHLYLRADNMSLKLGAMDDATMYFDATNLVFTSTAGFKFNTMYMQEVGTANGFSLNTVDKSAMTGRANFLLGSSAGNSLTSGEFNTAIGTGTLTGITTGSNYTAIGYYAMRVATGGYQSVAIGTQALEIVPSPSASIGLGHQAGRALTASVQDVYVGANAGNKAFKSVNNIGIGYGALNNISVNTSSNTQKNVAIGTEALKGSASASAFDSNTALGYQAGYSVAGNGNLFLGYQAGYSETGSNKLYIDNSNTSTPLLYGEFDNDYLKINGDLEITKSISTNALSPAEITGNTNDWAVNTHSFVRYTADGEYNLTGIVAGRDGQRLTLVNIGTSKVTLINESANSTAANRFITTTGGDCEIHQNDMAIMIYDAQTARWRALCT